MKEFALYRANSLRIATFKSESNYFYANSSRIASFKNGGSHFNANSLRIASFKIEATILMS